MKSIIVNIDQLLLDPNNYRLHSNPKYIYVEEKSIGNALVQKRIRKMLEGDNRINIKDLIDSFRTNGFLRMDNILVKKYEFQNDKYVVIEGNRRVTSLKALHDDYEDGLDIGRLSPKTFENLEVVFYDGNEESYALLMALRHVTGVKEWDDYEQSELIMNLKQKHGMDIIEISDRLGISKNIVKKRINSFIAMENYKEDEEFGQYFKPSLSAIFYEVMGKPDVRDWLGWEEQLNDFSNKRNLKRFFSWISPDEENKRPIIEKRDDIRELNKFVKDDEALATMEETRSVVEGLEQSNYYTQQGFKENIKSIKAKMGKISMSSLVNMNDETKKDVLDIINTLDKTVKGIKRIINSDGDQE